jgi:heme o synthase
MDLRRRGWYKGPFVNTAATVIAADVALPEKSRAAVLSELTKARLTLLVVLTTSVGYKLGSADGMDWLRFLHTVGGTAALGSGAAILNQYLEREHDARMRRTADRPLPSGRVSPDAALAAGAACSVTGMLWLAAAVNPLTAALGALTLASYLFVYTPLKRLTVMNTLVGAIPGALPPLMGWTAATGEMSAVGWALFAILFFWQLPHFFAIAWLYRDDYRDAGFKMLSGDDHDGRRTSTAAVRNTLALFVASLLPYLLGISGRGYLTGAFAFGTLFLLCAAAFARQPSRSSARRMFFASIVYLPIILSLLVLNQRRPTGGESGSAAEVGATAKFQTTH